MHNLKEIRKNFDDFKNALKGRFLKIDFNELKDLDIKNRNFIQKKESLENEKKEISKSKDEKLFKKSKEISEKTKQLEDKLNNEISKIDNEINGYKEDSKKLSTNISSLNNEIINLEQEKPELSNKISKINYETDKFVRVIKGPQMHFFKIKDIKKFFNEEFEISTNINRIGIRLSNNIVKPLKSHNIDSEGIIKGSVQIPGDGNPIILASDHPTIGGYPKIATVIMTDFVKLIQMPPRTKFFFKEKKGYGEKGATFLSLGCGVMVFNFFPFIIDGGGVSTRSGQPIGLSDSLFITGLVFIVCLWVSVYFEKR